MPAKMCRNTGETLNTGSPWEYTRAAPRIRLMVPRVTMNGCRPSFEIMVPLTTPTATPSRMPRPMAMGTLMPCSMLVVTTIPTRATSEPTERSMPPWMMTRVMPTAIMPLIEDWTTMLVRFSRVRKIGVR